MLVVARGSVSRAKHSTAIGGLLSRDMKNTLTVLSAGLACPSPSPLDPSWQSVGIGGVVGLSLHRRIRHQGTGYDADNKGLEMFLLVVEFTDNYLEHGSPGRAG